MYFDKAKDVVMKGDNEEESRRVRRSKLLEKRDSPTALICLR